MGYFINCCDEGVRQSSDVQRPRPVNRYTGIWGSVVDTATTVLAGRSGV
jgi:hypothetical protein